VRAFLFYLVSILVGGLFFVFARWLGNDYLFFAGYTVLQFIVLATAWNILGGYCGYVNFGTAAFFALGAYSSVALHKLGASIAFFPNRPGFAKLILPLNIPTLIILGGIARPDRIGTGYLTLGCAARSSPLPRLRSRSFCRR
jgi:branched-chain amino acid transport system permease protein